MDKLRFSFILGMLLCVCSGLINAATFTVTNNANDGKGSFRWAIEQANAESGVSKIVFDLSKPNDTITLTELITLSSSVEVDGSIKNGKVTIQGPELETLIHCIGMPNGGVFSLQKIQFGKWKESNGSDNNICLDLDEIENEGSAEFILNDVSVSGNPQKTCFVNATDTSWAFIVDNCYFENVQVGIRYGNKLTLKNSVFNECMYHATSNAVSEYLYVDNCEFHGGMRACFNSSKGEILNSLFDGTSSQAIYIQGKHCNMHIKACKFINNQTHCIYSQNTADDWHIEVEDCEFYDNKKWICYMIRSYTSTHTPEPSRLLFHDNYCGITKEGEIRPNGGGVWARMDYADIHDNVFGPNDQLPMIKDDGNDTIYVRDNYFGTNAEGIKAGGEYGAVYSTHISDNIQRWLPSDRLEYKYYEDNVFYGIKDYAIKTDSLTSFVTLKRNLFIDMPDYAIIDVQKKQVPVISSVEKSGDYIVIKGNAGVGSKVELFRSGRNPQSALKYLAIVDVDEKGDFTRRILRSNFDGEPVCISATATYRDRATSALSDPFCPCLPDTVFVADTIYVGESVLGKTFTIVGRHDSIFEKLKDVYGCDSIVMHAVIVKPDPTVKKYYVKENGSGDGRNWDHAMNGDDFAAYLPLVPEGTTFYVAEGTYRICGNGNLSDYYEPGYGYKSNRRSYRITSNNVSVIGGYSNKSTFKKEIHDSKIYFTFISGDCGEKNPSINSYITNAESYLEFQSLTTYDTPTLFDIEDGCDVLLKDLIFKSSNLSTIVSGTGTLRVDDCVFYDNTSGTANGVATCITSYGSISLTNCQIQYNRCQNGAYGLIVFDDECYVKNCNFTYNYGTHSPNGFIGSISNSTRGKGKLTVIQSRFENSNLNNNTPSGTLFNVKELYSENCVYRNNKFSAALIQNSFSGETTVCSFVNNTVICDSLYNVPIFKCAGGFEAEYVGNIMCTHGNEFINGGCNSVSSEYNLFSELNRGLTWIYYYWNPSATDIVTDNREDVYSIFSGSYNTTGEFSTKGVLIKDKLPDGPGIRFPLTQTTVTEDFLGVPRLKMTCMGAYELGCASDTIILPADTIPFGDKYLGLTYTSVGRHDSIFENLKDMNDCDSVVMHTLFVKPDPNAKEYYVKTDRQGKGDGSSWDDAIGGEDFAYVLPQVGSGTKFYIAQGTYYPVYDKNLKIPENIVNNVFYSKKCISLYGGFPASAKGTDMTCDPALYLTRLSGDLLKNDMEIESMEDFSAEERWEDVHNVVLIEPSEDGTIHIEGIVCERNLDHGRGNYGSCRVVVLDNSIKVTCEVSKCQFLNNTLALCVENCNAIVSDCYFNTSYIGLSVGGSSETNIVSRNTFENCFTQAFSTWGIGSVNHLMNNTIVKSPTAVLFSGDVTVYSYNNTIWGDVTFEEQAKVELIGNIVGGKVTGNLFNSAFNVYAESNSELNTSNTDIVTTQESILSILDNEEDQPKLNDNGGFTSTVALKRATLPDGISIRFLRAETTVTEDQRGVARMDSTCTGAYEINCSSDTTFVSDTIYVGEEFFGKTYTEVGCHDSIFDISYDQSDCQKVVMHTLYVKPDSSVLNYYVKTEKIGKGDGSDWDNAMDGKDFATYLPLAPDGATFYVAAGTYKPVYDKELKASVNLSDLCYVINSDVTIRGGYPAKATGDVPSEPDKYITQFDGAIDNNTTSDVQTLFLSTKENNITIYGLKLIHTKDVFSSSAALVLSSGTLKADQCSFDSCFCAISLQGNSSATIDSSSFYRSSAPAIYIANDASLNIENSNFENNKILYPSKTPIFMGAAIYSLGVLNVERCTFKNNRVSVNSTPVSGGGAIGCAASKARISYSLFENNISPHGGAIYIVSGDSIIVDGCTFVGNSTLLGMGNAIYSTARGGGNNYKLIANNTFYKNDDVEYFSNTHVIYGDDVTYVVNNTFVNNHVPCFQLSRTLVKGNIIISDTTIGSLNGVTSESNIVSDNIILENSKSIAVSEVSSFMDGAYNQDENIFVPSLDYHDGFTPTVALITDTLLDGTSIRFPRLEMVLTDQRGESRRDMTCIGAYEINCSPVITVVRDTVMVGDSYEFNGVDLSHLTTTVGFSQYNDTIKLKNGCDSIVMLRLAVRPEKKEGGYYVKINGSGDGSDWNNAMSPSDFSTYMALAYDDDTFHIAEGTYRSTVDDPTLGKTYFVSSSITLIGGYSDTITVVGEEPKPELYTTRLTADVAGNDNVYGHSTMSVQKYSNFKENDSILIYMSGNHTLKMFGMTLSGVKSCDGGAILMPYGGTLLLNRCEVRDNVSSAVSALNADVQVENSTIMHNYSSKGAAFRLKDSKLMVQGSTIYENMAEVADCNVTLSQGGACYLENTEASFENVTFASNIAESGAVFSIGSSQLNLINTTVVGNRLESGSTHTGSVIAALDDHNEVSLFGNMIVGNQQGEIDEKVKVTFSDYNIYTFDPTYVSGEHDSRMQLNEVGTILDEYQYSYEADIFEPMVKNNGGYTPTVAVIQSMFSGGEVVSIPQEARRVANDQRGYIRKDTSCIGAFEFPTFTGYYVKKHAEGDGTGRDWKNCMNDSTFARYFSIVPVGATFHIAEGVYSPMYDEYGKVTKSQNRKYSAIRPLNIKGGYPASAEADEVADPIKYRTIFSADYAGDDKYTLSDSEYSIIENDNYVDNGYFLINITSKLSGRCEISGVEFHGQRSLPRGSSAALQISSYNEETKFDVKLEKCSFVGNYAGVYAVADSLIVHECMFDSIAFLGVGASTKGDLKKNSSYMLVDKSTFANCFEWISNSNYMGQVRIENSCFANSINGFVLPYEYEGSMITNRVELYNNSLFSSAKKGGTIFLMYGALEVELKGNIISSNDLLFTTNKENPSPFVSDYNIYTIKPETYDLGKHDTLVSQASLTDILKGELKEDVFDVALSKERTYVKVPTLVNVNFAEGGGIKILPEKITPIVVDQRGVDRPSVDYCIGSIEADCDFSTSMMKMSVEKEVVCRGDEIQVKLSDLTSLEQNTCQFQWTSTDADNRFERPDSSVTRMQLKGQSSEVVVKVTVTNVCGIDTTLESVIKVNGTGEVPFTGIGEDGNVCLNVSEPIELITEVKGAKFSGECIVNGHFFDPTLAQSDSTVVRCYIDDKESDCQIFTERVIHIQSKDESVKPEIHVVQVTDQTCGIYPNGKIQFELSDITDHLTYRLEGPEYPVNVKESIEQKEDGVMLVTIDSIYAGEYNIYITDGCYDYGSESVEILDQYSIKSIGEPIIKNIHCYGEKNGEVYLHIKKNTEDFEMTLENLDKVEENPLLEFITDDTLHISEMAEGEHKLTFSSTSDVCPDASSVLISITAPSHPFAISELVVEGVGCEASINPVVEAEANENIEYKWTNLVSHQEVITESPEGKLEKSGAGKYRCVAYSKECDKVDTVYTEVSSSADVVDEFTISLNAVDESCQGEKNGRIRCVVDSVNHQRVDVTVVAENLGNGVVTLKTYNRADNIIRIESLEPGDYHVTAYQGSPECVEAPSDFDTTVTILPMLNSLDIISLDTVVNAVCLSNKDAYAKVTAIGVSSGLKMEVLQDDKVIKTYQYTKRSNDTAQYMLNKLVSGDFVARVINGCSDTASYNFSIGGTEAFKLSIDSTKSVFSYDCPTSDGPVGTVLITCEGGSDSMQISLHKYDRKNPTVTNEITDSLLYHKNTPQTISYTNLLSGKYLVRLQSLIPDCKDKEEIEFEVKGNDVIHLDSVIAKGVGCDALIIPYASGDETGYTFHWNNSISHKEKTTTDTLKNAGAGTFSCVAVSNHCKAYSDTLTVTVPSIADPIDFTVSLTTTNETCYEKKNGRIRCVIDSVNGDRVPVTIVAENMNSGTFIQTTYDDKHYHDNVVRVESLEPGDYHVTAYQGTLECVEAPSDFDTIVTIKPMLNKLQFLSLDSIKDAVCLAERDAHAYLTAIGIAPAQRIEVLDNKGYHKDYGYTKRKEDTAYYHIPDLVSGEFTARIINSCKDTVLYDFTIGGTQPYIVEIDSLNSVLKVKCPMDTTGIITAKFSGGADSCRYCLYKQNGAGSYELKVKNSIVTNIEEQSVKFTGLGKGNYRVVLQSAIPGCTDHKYMYITITGPADVISKKQVLDISCNVFNDGSISFKPCRNGVSYAEKYVIHRDSSLIKKYYDAYLLHKQVTADVMDRWGDIVKGTVYEPVYYQNDKNKQIVVKINKVFNSNEFYYRDGDQLIKIDNMDELEKSAPNLYQNDFVDSSFKWYKKKDKQWSEISMIMPDSSDYEEEWYYLKGDTIKNNPVWGCSHLDAFWTDGYGKYLETDAITLANLAPAWYKVVYEDSVGCTFSDSFQVKKPLRPLKFDSVRFDADLAKCDPTQRYITAYVDGGWGGYRYSFSPEVVVDMKNRRYDGYLGGNYIKNDNVKLKGVCRSEFLLPGNYLVMVVDEKGCFEKYNAGTRISVESKFTATTDTVNVLCPEGNDAPVVVNLLDKVYNGTYDVYEYASDCMTNTCDTCNRDTIRLIRTEARKDTVQLAFGDGTHGLFIYRTSDDQCGTYVPAVVTDTISPMRIQLEEKHDISCAEAPSEKTKDGIIKLSVLGGVPPYTLYRDKTLFGDEHIGTYTSFVDTTIRNAEGKAVKTIKIITLSNLEKGRYYFTAVDSNKCVRHMGADKLINDTVIVLKSPEPISALVQASSICPKDGEGLAEGVVFADDESTGGVFAKYTEGGVEPYRYSVDGFNMDSSDPYIPVVGDIQSKFNYIISDANGCHYDTTVMFGQDEIKVDRIDFLVSKYNNNGDIIALVDLCAPDASFDSVSYVLSGPESSKFEILDKRMYIYDISGGSEEMKTVLTSVADTRTIPDAFFSQNFTLLDKFSSINKHINFIRVNDISSSSGTAEIWRQCHIKMYAYFKGCRYTIEKNGIVDADLIISEDDYNMYEGGVKNNNDILEVTVSPNPYRTADKNLTIDITFGKKVDYEIFIYSMDGENSYHLEGKASELKSSGMADEYQVSKTISSGTVDWMKSQVFVVLVQTKSDAEAKLLLVDTSGK